MAASWVAQRHQRHSPAREADSAPERDRDGSNRVRAACRPVGRHRGERKFDRRSAAHRQVERDALGFDLPTLEREFAPRPPHGATYLLKCLTERDFERVAPASPRQAPSMLLNNPEVDAACLLAADRLVGGIDGQPSSGGPAAEVS